MYNPSPPPPTHPPGSDAYAYHWGKKGTIQAFNKGGVNDMHVRYSCSKSANGNRTRATYYIVYDTRM